MYTPRLNRRRIVRETGNYKYIYVCAYIRYMCIYAYTYLIGPDLLFEGGASEVRAENAKEEGIFSPPTPEPKTILGLSVSIDA